jgi:hypothetical protein
MVQNLKLFKREHVQGLLTPDVSALNPSAKRPF